MRHSSKRIFAIALLVALVAGCSTVQVAPTAPQAEAPQETQQRNAHWQFDGSNRPPAERDGYRPPLKLAVLLPLSGDLATAAASVRDGLLAGYYGERRSRPEIRFYDTANSSGGAVAAYNRAVADGADQVLGPLGRDGVDAVFRSVQPGVPVLALNHGVVAPPVNSASFSLAPEDEGSSAADYVASLGAKRVLVLSAGDDHARRSTEAFGRQLATQGGTTQVMAVAGEKPDLLPLLQSLAAGPGVDAIFIALRGNQARAIAPQLAAAGLAGKPRVATSQLLSGTGNAEEDRVLDGIKFPTERWGLVQVNGLPNVAETQKSLPTARGPAAKLFAFGFDAWLLTAYLEHLALTADGSVQGATGVLRISPEGNVLRTPLWSTFSNGYVVSLGSGG
ncbi:penicillin-binding protein activator [Luteimonas sp. 22616]|uniref:penicillin-binding protein activator n=1 Tax=Luteimonas sp. 22616 TaxID=3453951 RepID=UPI003F87CF77